MIKQSSWGGVIRALVISNTVSVVLFILRMFGAKTDRYWFLFWNLLLAWVPVVLVWLLTKELRHRLWKEPLPVMLTILWLGFLPNSFYLITDLVHLQNTGEVGLLYDSLIFMSIILNGLIAGMLSIYWVHTEIIKRRSRELAQILIGIIILAISFAIYLGRQLRWNTWDLLANPAGIIFDLSDHIINPLDHAQGFVITIAFFALLSSLYYVVWSFGKVIQARHIKY